MLTHAEQTLSETNQGEAVNQIRHLFQQTMNDDFQEAIERLSGRRWSRSSAATTSSRT